MIMPRIHVRTNEFISKDKKYSMVREFKEVVDTIPWEIGEHLMADFEGECAMLYGEDAELPVATVEFNILEKVYLKVDDAILERALFNVTAIVSNTLKIKPNRIFAFFRPIPMWAWEGINIEKTIIKIDEEPEHKEHPGEYIDGNYKHLRCGFL